MRPRTGPQGLVLSGAVSKATYKQRKQCVGLELTAGTTSSSSGSSVVDGITHLPSPLSDGLSLSQLMRPAAAQGTAAPSYAQLAVTAPLQPLLQSAGQQASPIQSALAAQSRARPQIQIRTERQPTPLGAISRSNGLGPTSSNSNSPRIGGWQAASPMDRDGAAGSALHGERAERSVSIAASVSSLGSLSTAHSPESSGVDPRTIEAALPQPAPDTLDNMLKAYFRYQYPSSGIVLEEFFWFRYHRHMLTPLIIYAMLAVATWNLATDAGGARYGAAHESFYRTAKQHVEAAMDEAHLRSVQGLLVLANYEALVGRWGTMWNHTTMARRLAEGIIFRDTDFPWRGVQHGEFDFEMQRVQRAYWHSLINDIWASVLMDKQIGGIEITLPPRPTHDFTYRHVRLEPTDTAPGYRVELGAGALDDPRHGSTAASGTLFLLIGAINNAAFLFQHASKPPLFETFIDFEMRLTDWYLTLAADVRLDDATIARFTRSGERADLGEIISTHIFWNFARLLLMRMGLVLSLREDPALLRNIYSTKAFYTTDSRALQFYQNAMPILTPDRAASYDEWLFHFCRCMSLQSAQNVVNLLKLGEHHGVHPGHFGAGLNLPLVQVVSVSMGLVRSPDAQVVRIALDHLLTVMRTLLRLKHWFNTALLLLHLFLSMQDPALVLPPSACVDPDPDIDAACPFPPAHLITEMMRRLRMPFEAFVSETICAVRISSPTKDRVDPGISPLLRHLPAQSDTAADDAARAPEPEWFRFAPSYLRSAWKRLVRTYRATEATAAVPDHNN